MARKDTKTMLEHPNEAADCNPSDPYAFDEPYLSSFVPNAPRHSYGLIGNICQFKLILIGGGGVGKSSLAVRFVRGCFPQYSEATIGSAFLTRIVRIDDKAIKFNIWDTAGQERYNSVAPFYYRGAQAAIAVYDIQNQNSFFRAHKLVKELQEQASPNIMIALAGNKVDLAANRTVNYMKAKKFAEENGLLFMETSGRTGANANEIFFEIAKKLFKNECIGDDENIRLTTGETDRSTKCCK